MATSGTSQWETNVTDLISAALRKLAVLEEGGLPNTAQLTNGVYALNSVVKLLETKGMPVWAMQNYDLVVQKDVSKYIVAPTMADVVTNFVPLKVVQAWKSSTTIYSTGTGFSGNVGSDDHVPIRLIGKYDFDRRTSQSRGAPVEFFYEPKLGIGEFNVWPTPDQNYFIQFVGQRGFADIGTGQSTLDFPSYWTDALVYHLAWRLAPEYAIPLQDRQAIMQEAKYFEEEALSFGTEEGSLFLQPERTWR